MKLIIEVIGETLSELIGAAAVFGGLAGAIVLFNSFGGDFISYFV